MTRPCLPWRGARTAGGYGVRKINGRCVYVHRLAWSRARKKRIPTGLSVLHRCDRPWCVEPSHLWLGTQRDNMRDASRKGRLRRSTNA